MSSELGHNKVDSSYTGSVSTLQGELMNEDGNFGRFCPKCNKPISNNIEVCPCTKEEE